MDKTEGFEFTSHSDLDFSSLDSVGAPAALVSHCLAL